MGKRSASNPDDPASTQHDEPAEPVTHPQGGADQNNAEIIWVGAPNPVPISTTGITVENGYLCFPSQEALMLTMSEITNRSRADISTWGNTLSFVSLYDVKQLEEDNAFDQYAVSLTRIPDHYFESVLSPDAKIKVGNDIYTYNFPAGILTVTHPDQTTTTHVISGLNKKNTADGFHIERTGRITYNNQFGLDANKFLTFYYLYGSIGTNMSYWEKPNSRWIKVDRYPLRTWIDPWHTVTWWANCFQGPATQGSKTNKVYKSWGTQRDMCAIVTNGTCYFYTVDFPRTHNYKQEDVEHDVHVEGWP